MKYSHFRGLECLVITVFAVNSNYQESPIIPVSSKDLFFVESFPFSCEMKANTYPSVWPWILVYAYVHRCMAMYVCVCPRTLVYGHVYLCMPMFTGVWPCMSVYAHVH